MKNHPQHACVVVGKAFDGGLLAGKDIPAFDDFLDAGQNTECANVCPGFRLSKAGRSSLCDFMKNRHFGANGHRDG